MPKSRQWPEGLIIGKFMPPHLGHMGLIRFGSRHCRHLTLAVCSRPGEPIDGALRRRWLEELTSSLGNVSVVRVTRDLPQDSRPSRRASLVWSRYLARRFPRTEVVFSSEIYGDFLAEYMGIEHRRFDLRRGRWPVSGTAVRRDPLGNWRFIPEAVRPHFVRRICVYGPESTGKTTLARELADRYDTVWVPEFARGHIAARGNRFTYGDMSRFVAGQVRSEEAAARRADKLLFCDTDPITTLIYSRHYFGRVPATVEKTARERRHDLYLLTDVDLPWVADPQRDLGRRRREFAGIFRRELEERGLLYVLVTGKGRVRTDAAAAAVDKAMRQWTHEQA